MHLRSPSGGSTTLRFPSAFALGRTGVRTSSSTSDHSELLPFRSLLAACSGATAACVLSIDVRGTPRNDARSGDGVFERCVGSRGPCGAGGGGASDCTEA